MASFPREWKNEKSLGEGGQGWAFVVSKIADPERKRFVLKRLKNKDRLERFQKEIDVLKKLSHQGILKIIETGESEDRPFYIAEYCENGDLSKLDLSKRSLLEKLHLFRQICNAVAAAHDAKIIHRDLKPQNILVRSDGSLVVGDFGLCLDLTEIEERLTLTSEPVGARYYIAPELEDGRVTEPEPSSDVYSLGKILYFILSGKSFSRERYRNTPNDLRTPDCELGIYFVYDIFDKSIQIEPRFRYKDAHELLKALDEVILKIEHRANVLNSNVPQHCLYCGTGNYRQEASSSDLMLVCHNCGNIQKFITRPGRGNWWKTS